LFEEVDVFVGVETGELGFGGADGTLEDARTETSEERD
jgi:hypothetical protein